MTSPSTRLDPETAFTLLSNGRRRRLLRELRRTGTMTLDDAARRVAATERGTSPGAVGARARKSVHVSLYQTHVPRLVEEGVVRYDADARTVSLVRCPTTRRLLRMLDDDDRPPDRHYAAAALVGAALVAATAVVDGGETAWRVVAGVLGATAAGVAATDGRDRLSSGEGAWSTPFRRGDAPRGADGAEPPAADRANSPESDRPTSDSGGGGPPGR